MNDPDMKHQVGCFVVNSIFALIMIIVSYFTDSPFG